MGRRGPAPMPTKLKLLHGETRAQRLNHAEPKPTNTPVAPEDLGGEARAVWDRLMADFGHTGVLTAVDQDAMRIYCEAVARYEHAAKMLEKSGPLVRGARSGDLIKNPLHQIVRDNAVLVRAMARELGFTPSARTGLQTPEREDGDPFEKWAAQ